MEGKARMMAPTATVKSIRDDSKYKDASQMTELSDDVFYKRERPAGTSEERRRLKKKQKSQAEDRVKRRLMPLLISICCLFAVLLTLLITFTALYLQTTSLIANIGADQLGCVFNWDDEWRLCNKNDRNENDCIYIRKPKIIRRPGQRGKRCPRAFKFVCDC